jgi:hypothetical protein
MGQVLQGAFQTTVAGSRTKPAGEAAVGLPLLLVHLSRQLTQVLQRQADILTNRWL